MNKTTKDPRACKIPMTEFNHLSLAEIDLFFALSDKRWLDECSRLETKRYLGLLDRRVFPDRGHNKGNAA